jgi:3-dehydroquinate synthase II
MPKLLWVSADGVADWEKRKQSVTSALESGADAVIVNSSEAEKVRELGQISVVSRDDDADIVLAESKNSKPTAFLIKITNKEDERKASKASSFADFVVVETTDWTIIPLENLIADLHKKDSSLIAKVKSLEEAKTALETLEIGVDGILFEGKPIDIAKVKKLIDSASSAPVGLTIATVSSVKPVGMGDRVCVDTCSLFSVGEGMLVGSQSNALFLVHSETIESPYVAARPFRVNAGPVHAYTILPNGKTTYLSELSAGDEVLAVDKEGKTRSLIIGRLKIEKRPLIIVEADVGGKKIKTILQNAETIRLVAKDGSAISVAKLKKGDEILVYLEDAGRHFGVKVEESINEK